MIEKTFETQETTTAISVAAKERLAKLLATEDVTVEHRDVPTAAFDIQNRVLILPNWSDITKDIYDLLVCHEVGHALWTPFEGWHGAVSVKGANYKGFLNVTEDARIEKKIKRKFPGARRSFVKGYTELIARDFFGTKERELDSFGLIDRLNLHFKAGALANVPFADDEKVWVDRMGALETFEDAIALADDLFAAMKEDAAPETDTAGRGEGEEGEGEEAPDDEKGEANPLDNDPGSAEGDAPKTDGDGEAEGMEGEPGEGENGEADADTEKAEGDDTNSTDSSGADGDDGDDEASGDIAEAGESAGRGANEGVSKGSPFSETDAAFREKEEELVSNDDLNKAPNYLQIPADDAFDLDAIIVDNKTVVRELKEAAFSKWVNGGWVEDETAENVEVAKTQVATYRKKNAKIINYLAKEFEMRKAADASKRTSVAKTGVLDTNTLHSYKWNDDIFKKVASVTDGKSHGLQMFVDWSGSMSSNMFGTINQVLNLVLFCKKVGIPFDVYAFTDSYESRWTRPADHPVTDRLIKSKLVKGDFNGLGEFNLLQIATSQGNKAAFNDMLIGLIILRGAYNHSRRYTQNIDDCCYYNLDRKYGLGGTPLNEAIMASIPIINRFRKANGIQIVNSVFLTDGDGCALTEYHKGSGMHDTMDPSGKIIVRDRKSHKEFVQQRRWYSKEPGEMAQTRIFLEMVRIRTGAKICNFYVANPRPMRFKVEWMDSMNEVYEHYSHWTQEDLAAAAAAFKIAKVDGGVTIENSISGWDHHYLIMGGEDLSGSDDEGLDESLVGATKAKLKSAFGKASTGKLRNRVILRKFVGLIAA